MTSMLFIVLFGLSLTHHSGAFQTSRRRIPGISTRLKVTNNIFQKPDFDEGPENILEELLEMIYDMGITKFDQRKLMKKLQMDSEVLNERADNTQGNGNNEDEDDGYKPSTGPYTEHDSWF